MTLSRCYTSAITLSATVFCMAYTSPAAYSADLVFTPNLTLSQEFTDNVAEVSTGKRSDYITRAQPGLAMKYKAPFWDWDLAYNFDYRYYARNSRTDDTTHNANVKSLVKIVDEVLFLDMSDTYKRVSLNVARDTSTESLYKDQSDQNVGIVSPYLQLRPAANLNIRTGYRYTNTWYKDPGAINRQDHVGFLSAAYEFSDRMFITTDYTFTREIPDKGSRFDRHEVLVGPRYEYADKSFIFAQGGFIASDYSGSHSENTSWKGGFSHAFDTVTANITIDRSYSADPTSTTTLSTSYTAALTKTLKRGSASVSGSYREYEDGSSSNTNRKNSWSGSCGSNMELLPDITANLGFTYERFHDIDKAAYTDRYYVDSGISWQAGKNLSIGLVYKFIDYSSAKIPEDNRQVNRAILEAKLTY